MKSARVAKTTKAAVKKKAVATRSKSTARKPAARKAKGTKLDRDAMPRRMIFVDVENTSSEERLASVLEHLKIDHKLQRTELAAVGNWKAVGSRSGRMLARAGAHLMHSAPATGVRDWSDLWIAVAAGCWIAKASPGDCLDIVSDDHAFDAVADSAAAYGVEFHRISYRTLGAAPLAAVAEEPSRDGPPKRRRRGGRRRNGAGAGSASPELRPQQAPAPRPHAPAPLRVGSDAGTATPEDIRDAVQRLTAGDPERWVNLDLVGNALRAAGFTRPPGSPRLVTRVRQVHDIEVSPTGMARIKPQPAEAVEVDGNVQGEAVAAKPARRRRAPRKRSAVAD